ncbi:restriction endonuclease subunit S [Flavobacterium sasangense]|uniref:restriction endonuclease subunit S n=1 Tax=Flavobacterium sasangense TaxID=503361 RepID=UPI0004796ABE|nr:restriction endonuclease subunit S [Flavobacterium sasangense]
MNKIEQLIQKYCPRGVEFIEVGQICDIKTGKGITKNDAVDGGLYPIISGGKQPMGYYKTHNRKANCVTISRVGANAGFVNFIDIDFYLNDKCFSVLFKEENNVPKYLFYYLKSIEDKIKELQSEGGVPTINTSKVTNIKIPIPPLPIQQEIVTILDKFTALEAELEAELEARSRQYEYYRNQLLAFEDRDVEWKALNEISVNLDSKRKPVKGGSREKGSIPYYGASGIVDYVKDYIFDGDYLLISEDGANLLARKTPIAFSISGKTWVNNHAHILEFDNYATRRLVEYYLNSIDLTPFISGAAQPKLNQQNLNKIKIPIPSLEEQERIVNILDQFDALVNDIKTGLPAEIKARRAQYEYYRKKLLTFNRVN